MTHSDSIWNHSLCDPCWARRCIDRGEVREPVRVGPPGEAEPDDCCQCGLPHRSGIYVRGAAEDFPHCAKRKGRAN